MLKFLDTLQLRTISLGMIGLMIGVGILVAGATYKTLSEVQKIGDQWISLQTVSIPKNQNSPQGPGSHGVWRSDPHAEEYGSAHR